MDEDRLIDFRHGARAMLAAAEKLEYFNREYNSLLVEIKVLEKEPEANHLVTGVNTASPRRLLSGSPGSAKFTSPGKVMTPPRVGGDGPSAGMKRGHPTLSGRPAPFASLSVHKQYEELHKISNLQTDMRLTFGGLRMALRAAERVRALKRALGWEEGPTVSGQDRLPGQSKKSSGGPARPEDPEEIEFIRELLEEQEEVQEKLTKVEEERMALTLELLKAKVAIVETFNESRTIFQESAPSDVEDSTDDGDEDEENNGENRRSRGTEQVGGDLKNQLNRKQKKLLKEEARLDQMKFLTQKLMGMMPNNAMIFDKETNDRYCEMILMCGKEPGALRGDSA